MNGIHEVGGSIPPGSTKLPNKYKLLLISYRNDLRTIDKPMDKMRQLIGVPWVRISRV